MHSTALLVLTGALLIIGGSWLAPRIGVAAPILLVLVGIAGSLLPGLEPLEIEPEWILAGVLPPILYAAAVNVPMTDFRRNFRAISGLSVGLVILSAIAVGLVLTWLVPGLPLAAGIALGAVVAPPDAVAATSIGRRLGLPPRLVTVLEGEGLLNDATALVLLRSAVVAIGGGFTFLDVAWDFVFAVVVAIVVGAAVGFGTVWVRARIGQPTLTTAISFTVPFLAFLPTEALDASGVLAVVVAGLVTGFRSPGHLTAQDRISERMNWGTIQLMLENGVFLVMGFQISHVVSEVAAEGRSVAGAIGVGLAITVVLFGVRLLFCGPLMASLRWEQRQAVRRLARSDSSRKPQPAPRDRRTERHGRRLQRRRADWQVLAEEGIGWRGAAVITWSGMRGVVTLAAAQSLPLDVPFRAELILIAFTVALVTLVLHGATLPTVIRLVGVTGPDEAARKQEIQSLIDEIVAAGAARLSSDSLRRADGQPFDPELVTEMTLSRADVTKEFWDLRVAAPSAAMGQRLALFDEMMRAEQAALIAARTAGRYSSEALTLAQMVLDSEQARTIQHGLG